jgi:hypothetical protein
MKILPPECVRRAHCTSWALLISRSQWPFLTPQFVCKMHCENDKELHLLQQQQQQKFNSFTDNQPHSLIRSSPKLLSLSEQFAFAKSGTFLKVVKDNNGTTVVLTKTFVSRSFFNALFPDAKHSTILSRPSRATSASNIFNGQKRLTWTKTATTKRSSTTQK